MVVFNLSRSLVPSVLACSLLLGSASAHAQAEAVTFELPKNHGGFQSFAISPDGRMVAGGTGVVTSSSGGKKDKFGAEVLLWDRTKKGKIRKTLKGHTDTPDWLRYSSDGAVLVSVATDLGEVYAWSGAGKRLNKFKPLGKVHGHVFKQVAMDEKGTLVVVLTTNEKMMGKVAVRTGADLVALDIRSGRELWRLSDTKIECFAIDSKAQMISAFSQESEWKQTSERSVSQTNSKREYFTLGLKTGKVTKPVPMEKNTSIPDLISYLPGSSVLVGTSNRGLFRYDTKTGVGEEKMQWDKNRRNPFSVSVSGKAVARATTNYVEVRDLRTGKVLHLQESEDFKKALWNVAFSRDLDEMAFTREHKPQLSPITLSK